MPCLIEQRLILHQIWIIHHLNRYISSCAIAKRRPTPAIWWITRKSKRFPLYTSKWWSLVAYSKICWITSFVVIRTGMLKVLCQIFLTLILQELLLTFWSINTLLYSLSHWALDLLDGAIIIISDLCLRFFNFDFLVYFGWVSSIQIVFALPWRWWLRVSTGSFSDIFKLNLWSFLRYGPRILPRLLVIGRKNTLGLSLSIIMVKIGPINWRCLLRDHWFTWENNLVLTTLHRRPSVSNCRI